MHWDRRLGSRLAAAMLGINGVKGFEIGAGFEAPLLSGREAAGCPEISGGLDGGMTNGHGLVLRCAVKAVPGLPGGAQAVDLKTFRDKLSVSKTSDTTAVFAAAVVGEHMAALELAGALLEKFGGDSLSELASRLKEWRGKTGKILRRL
jgi:chorismate synthase